MTEVPEAMPQGHSNFAYLIDSRDDLIDAQFQLPDPVDMHRKDQEPSQLNDTVYVQGAGGFKPTSRKHVEKLLEAPKNAKETDYDPDKVSFLEKGLTAHQLFRSFSFTLQGLIAGFSIFHAMLVILRTPPFHDYNDFLDDTYEFALIFHSMYYVALVLSLVGVLDRHDIADHPRRVVWRAVTMQSTGLSVVCWVAALASSLACLPAEARVNLYGRNSSHFIIDDGIQAVKQPWTDRTLNMLRISIILRAVFASLGWIIVGLRPSTDKLMKHLIQADNSFKELMKKAIDNKNTDTPT